MNRKEIINSTANQVRTDLEIYQKNTKTWTKGLRGACATAASWIKNDLERQGISSQLYYGRRKRWGSGHVWLETSDFIIDVTYTQFKADARIVFIDKTDTNLLEFYYEGFSRGSIEKVNEEFFCNWPEDQNPNICLEFVQEVRYFPHLYPKK